MTDNKHSDNYDNNQNDLQIGAHRDAQINSAAKDNITNQANTTSTDTASTNTATTTNKREFTALPIWKVAAVLVVSIVLISCFKHDRLASYWQQTYQQTTAWSMLEKIPFWSNGVKAEQALNTDKVVDKLSVMGDEGNDKLNETLHADILEHNRQIEIERAKRLAEAKEAARLEAIKRERERLIIKEMTITPSQKIFFAGDSMMQGVAPWAMRELHSEYGIDSIDLSKQSTGLSYSSFFDWPATIEQTLSDNPDIAVMVMFLGANDPWAIPDPAGAGKPYIKFNTPEWKVVYSERIDRIMQAAKDNQVQVMWLTPPTMKAEKLRNEMAVLTQLYHDSLPNTKALVIDSKPILHDDNVGKEYTDSVEIDGKQVKVRTADGIHFTPTGQKLLAKEIMSHIKVVSDTQ